MKMIRKLYCQKPRCATLLGILQLEELNMLRGCHRNGLTRCRLGCRRSARLCTDLGGWLAEGFAARLALGLAAGLTGFKGACSRCGTWAFSGAPRVKYNFSLCNHFTTIRALTWTPEDRSLGPTSKWSAQHMEQLVALQTDKLFAAQSTSSTHTNKQHSCSDIKREKSQGDGCLACKGDYCTRGGGGRYRGGTCGPLGSFYVKRWSSKGQAAQRQWWMRRHSHTNAATATETWRTMTNYIISEMASE